MNRNIKVGSIIESGLRGQISSGKVLFKMEHGGLGNRHLYKCEFNNPVVIANEGAISEIEPYSKAKKVHLLYSSQFEILDF